jgi:hypothetical protein
VLREWVSAGSKDRIVVKPLGRGNIPRRRLELGARDSMEGSAEGYWPDCREKGEDELVTAAIGANESISLVLGDNRPPADDLRYIVVDSSAKHTER